MRENRGIRLIRKAKPQPENESSLATQPVRQQPSEREIKTAVTRWVREHRERSEEFRLTFAALLRGGEFRLPSR